MDASKASATDICPVCKSMSQTSPNLRFKVSSKCYHRICEACVDRKFSAGKAQCPLSGCDKMLWKRDWRTQTFEDVMVEREVDKRRYVWRVLDLGRLGLKPAEGEEEMWETAFETKRAYDDFLELREELAMNLIMKTDVKGTQRRLDDFLNANGLGKDGDGGGKEKRVYRDGEAVDLSGLIKGLKPRRIQKVVLFDPWETVWERREYYDENIHPVQDVGVAGYDYRAYMDESLLRAFSGLGVFVGAA